MHDISRMYSSALLLKTGAYWARLLGAVDGLVRQRLVRVPTDTDQLPHRSPMAALLVGLVGKRVDDATAQAGSLQQMACRAISDQRGRGQPSSLVWASTGHRSQDCAA